MTERDRGDPEEVSYDSERHKRPSDDTQVVKVQADALLAPATNKDNLSDVYFIGELIRDCSGSSLATVHCGQNRHSSATRHVCFFIF